MKVLLCLLFLLNAPAGQTQTYRPVAVQKDSFSLALVQLLQCAAQDFASCKGDSIRSTWLMGDDYQLQINFPQSAIGIVRIRDWDKNAYVEFRGFKTEEGARKGLQQLFDKIKKALGPQAMPSTATVSSLLKFYSFSIRDSAGYFSPNIELFGGSSSANPYLLGPEKEAEGRKEYFVLLKVYRGIPAYQFFISPSVKSQDDALHQALQKLLILAEDDFDLLRKNPRFPQQKKRSDTFLLFGHKTRFNFRGERYFATISFPVSGDATAMKTRWQYYQNAIQAVLGSGYVYLHDTLGDEPSVLYYAKDGPAKATVRLKREEQNGQFLIVVKIQSEYAHRISRSYKKDDI